MDQAVLSEGQRKQLRFVSFAVEAGSLPDWQRRLESAGVKLADAPIHAADGGLWFCDPDDVQVNLREDELVPWRKAAPEDSMFNFGDDIQRVDQARWLTADAPASPRRLSHMLIFVSSLAASERFYTELLGLRLSDRIKGMATFLNAGPGDHHVFGFIQSTHPGLHHSSWEVPNFDQLAIGARTMQERGYQEGWGLGRHTLGSNMFHYIRDPWGSWIEYSTDMDRITEAWKASDWDIPPAVWCPMPPETFLANLEDQG
ncbi:VOC family protein [Kribbella sp. NPDC050820]|uniref:VOC family protein n=1 Tax=Kribbella sp. NPDC050820 TaxID=3155408 RepID=UPI0033DB9C60